MEINPAVTDLFALASGRGGLCLVLDDQHGVAEVDEAIEILGAVSLAAWLTDTLGIYAVFGAFVLGARNIEKDGHVEVGLSGIVGTELWDQRCTVVLSAAKAIPVPEFHTY